MDAITILTTIFSLNAPFSVSPIAMDDTAFFNTVAIRGTVRETTYHRPLSGAKVYAVSETSVQIATTGADGRFYFFALLPGSYRLGAYESGYENNCFRWPRREAVLLSAGYEYDATLWLQNWCH